MIRNYSLSDLYAGVPLRDMMEQLLSEARVMSRSRARGQEEAPLEAPVNMYETDTDLMVVLPLPGISPNDIEVEVLGTQLHVRTHARRDEPRAETGPQGGGTGQPMRRHRWLLHEFRIGPYERTVELPYPVDPDRCDATYEHGLLALRFPRPAAERPRRITLGGATAGQSVSVSQQGTSAETPTSAR
jgi:HSP20 family protein